MIIRLELPSHIPIVSHIQRVRFFTLRVTQASCVGWRGWDICVHVRVYVRLRVRVHACL